MLPNNGAQTNEVTRQVGSVPAKYLSFVQTKLNQCLSALYSHEYILTATLIFIDLSCLWSPRVMRLQLLGQIALVSWSVFVFIRPLGVRNVQIQHIVAVNVHNSLDTSLFC